MRLMFGYSCCQSGRPVDWVNIVGRKDMACYSPPLPPSMAALACMLMIHTYTCMVWWTVLCLGAAAVNQAQTRSCSGYWYSNQLH